MVKAQEISIERGLELVIDWDVVLPILGPLGRLNLDDEIITERVPHTAEYLPIREKIAPCLFEVIRTVYVCRAFDIHKHNVVKILDDLRLDDLTGFCIDRILERLLVCPSDSTP